MSSTEALIGDALKAWRFLYRIPVYPDPRLIHDRRRGEALARALGAHRACISAGLGKPIWIDEQTATGAGAELIENRGPFRRVWALVESENEE